MPNKVKLRPEKLPIEDVDMYYMNVSSIHEVNTSWMCYMSEVEVSCVDGSGSGTLIFIPHVHPRRFYAHMRGRQQGEPTIYPTPDSIRMGRER